MPLKSVYGQSYKATISTFGPSLVDFIVNQISMEKSGALMYNLLSGLHCSSDIHGYNWCTNVKHVV